MCDKMAISVYILKISGKGPFFLRLQMRTKEMFNCHQFFSTNNQCLKIKLQNETNRWSIFGQDEILIKLRFKGLTDHFFIFDHN